MAAPMMVLFRLYLGLYPHRGVKIKLFKIQVSVLVSSVLSSSQLFAGTRFSGKTSSYKSAKVNAIRTRTLIENCDVAVVCFGDKFKQWNAAFDTAAMAWAKTPVQVIELLQYVTTKK
ncbi:MAG: hypothetical protein ACI809_001013 [Candidatus Azotimanducaceae bacterium]|jgi:hypothetical protein